MRGRKRFGYSIPHIEYWRYLERSGDDLGTTHNEPDLPERFAAGLIRAMQYETLRALRTFAEQVDDPLASKKLERFIGEELENLLVLDDQQVQVVAKFVGCL